MRQTLTSLAAVLLLAAACGDAGADGVAEERSTRPIAASDDTIAPATTSPLPADDVPTGLGPLVTAARADLAERTGSTEATVVTAEFVVWPDRSLGCPQPGLVYTQVLSEGYRIVLDVGGVRYHYHGGGGTGPFLCESPAKPAPDVNPGGGDS